jgi:hypothetical protein
MRMRSPRTVQQMQPLFISKSLLVGLDDELVVHADLAELILDDGDLFAVLLGEDAVEEGGFAGAEEAGEDSDGNGGRHEGRVKGESGEAKLTKPGLQPGAHLGQGF